MSLASSLLISRNIPQNNGICSRFVVQDVVGENLLDKPLVRYITPSIYDKI